MFIQTEDTPNPNTIKFIPGEDVSGKNIHLNRTEKSTISPLADSLFKLEKVKSVFLGSDFISVTKSDDASWDILKTEVLTTIMDHYVAGKPIINEKKEEENSSDSDDKEDPIITEIKELIETRVRPAVAQDGGDIIFHGFEDGVVKLEMHGACSGCPSSSLTLKSGIENMLQYYIPEVKSVEAIENISE
ncbi:NifU family protein [Rickettsiales bacterium]|nr:NifU family protein [Rickettsiales bacterium]